MSEKTKNLNLYKRNIDDPVSLRYFNDNMDTIDEVLGVLPGRLNLLTADVRDNTSDIKDLQTEVAGKAPINHADADTTYGGGDATHFGHVKLCDDYDTVYENTNAANSVGASAWALQKVNSFIGDISTLDTTDKTSVVDAVNEVVDTAANIKTDLTTETDRIDDIIADTAIDGTAAAGTIGDAVKTAITDISDVDDRVDDIVASLPFAERSGVISQYRYDTTDFIEELYSTSGHDVLGNDVKDQTIKTAVQNANKLIKMWGTADTDNFIALVDRRGNTVSQNIATCMVILFVTLADGGSVSGVWTKQGDTWTWTESGAGSGTLNPEDLEPINTAISTNASNIASNTSAINTLKGDDTTNGSVAKSIKDAIANANIPTPERMNAIETGISNVSYTISILQGGENTQGSIDQRIKYAVEHVDISGNLDYQAVNTKAQDNEDAIEVINGDDQTQGSTDYKIKQAINGLNLTNYQAFTKATTDISNNASAIQTLNGNDTVQGSVDYKIKQAID